MPFIGECLALKNAHRREQAPAVQQPRLARREARLVNQHNFVVVKNQPMEQVHSTRREVENFSIILTWLGQGTLLCEDFGECRKQENHR